MKLFFTAVLLELPNGSLIDPATIELVEPCTIWHDQPPRRSVEGTRVRLRSGRWIDLEEPLEKVVKVLRDQAELTLPKEDEGE